MPCEPWILVGFTVIIFKRYQKFLGLQYLQQWNGLSDVLVNFKSKKSGNCTFSGLCLYSLLSQGYVIDKSLTHPSSSDWMLLHNPESRHQSILL